MASTLVMTLMSKASEKGTNLRSAARDAGISEETAKNWIRGISEPTDEEVKKICNVLGCSVPKDKKEKEKTEKGVPPTREEMQKLAKEGPAPETLVVGEAKSAPETQKHILKATEKATMATKGDFMPPPVQEELFPKTTTQKEEKKMDNTTVVEKKIPAEDKPKKAKSASPKKTGKKSLLSEHCHRECNINRNNALTYSGNISRYRKNRGLTRYGGITNVCTEGIESFGYRKGCTLINKLLRVLALNDFLALILACFLLIFSGC